LSQIKLSEAPFGIVLKFKIFLLKYYFWHEYWVTNKFNKLQYNG